MKYCILGGGGSFGINLAKYLLTRDDTEYILSIGRSPEKAKPFLLGLNNAIERYDYREAHITYMPETLGHFLDLFRPDVIVNFAAQGESGTSFTESWRYFETNCAGLARLVEWLNGKEWLKKFVHIGSSEVYGSTKEPATELHPLNPTSPYAISKAAFDQFLFAYHHKTGFPGLILRPSNAYGPGQQLHRFIPKSFLFAMTGRKMPLHGGGRAQKSFIHTEDLSRGIYLAAKFGLLGNVYNLGPPAPNSMLDVAQKIADVLSVDFDTLYDFAEDRAHQDSRYWLNSDRAALFLGWKPMVGWVTGLLNVYGWVKENLDELRHMPTEFVMRP